MAEMGATPQDDTPTHRIGPDDVPTQRISPDETPTQRVASDDPMIVRGLTAGQRIFDRFVLEKVAGRGGMGVVWRATDSTLDELVALKFLPEIVARDSVAIDELKEETRRARRLTHPNIVRIHDFLQDEHQAAVSMEFVAGATLAQQRLEQPGKVAATSTKSTRNESGKGGRTVPVESRPSTQTQKAKSKTSIYIALGAAVLASVLAYLFWPKSEVGSSGALEKIRGTELAQAMTIPGLNLTLQPIPPGTFIMGNASSSWTNEKPATNVTITKAYWLGKTEVTQEQWQAIMGTNPSNFKGAGLPVEQVSWTDAMEFCQKLTERERAGGRLPKGYVYTLPTEAQWEYACRSGTTGDYAGNLDSMGWYGSNSGKTTHPVGQKLANSWGLSDMHGDVWEWCADWNGNYPGGSVTDPTGPASGSLRVRRGGSLLAAADLCRSTYRGRDEPDLRGNGLGFRLALSSVP